MELFIVLSLPTANMLLLASTSDLVMSREILRLTFGLVLLPFRTRTICYSTSTETLIQHRSSCFDSVGEYRVIWRGGVHAHVNHQVVKCSAFCTSWCFVTTIDRGAYNG